ncbi:hypothetical protein Acr_27g0002380 [Actinidia rufa]|uniref:CCHC-type domain-containing protein n=1 Tax=Actinidia rufa TaxID=165716 RepID=A0A7J0H618_9ERIC|nr:hypothetical protein Acr_27g0002380 [Actinidia rufa]
MRDLGNSIIHLFLGNNTLQEVINKTDPAKPWAKFESRYKSKSLINQLYLKKQPHALHMMEGANFMEHLNEFKRLLIELEVIGVKVEEENKAVIMLVSLSPTYEHLSTTLMYRKDTLRIDETVATLLSHKSMRKKETENYSKERAMIAADGGHVRGQTTERRDGSKLRGRSQLRGCPQSIDYKKKCYYCDKEGHIIKFCPKLKAKKKEKEKKN